MHHRKIQKSSFLLLFTIYSAWESLFDDNCVNILIFFFRKNIEIHGYLTENFEKNQGFLFHGWQKCQNAFFRHCLRFFPSLNRAGAAYLIKVQPNGKMFQNTWKFERHRIIWRKLDVVPYQQIFMNMGDLSWFIISQIKKNSNSLCDFFL